MGVRAGRRGPDMSGGTGRCRRDRKEASGDGVVRRDQRVQIIRDNRTNDQLSQ